MSEVKKQTKTKKATKKVNEEKKIVKKAETKKEKKVVKDETIKKEDTNKSPMSVKSQIYYRSLSKVIYYLAKIGRIALMIFVPFVFLAMILIPFLFKKFEVDANIIRFDGVTVIINSDKVSIKINDETNVFNADPASLDRITTFLNENSKTSVITYIELSLLLFAIVIIIDIYLLCNVEKIFNNFIRQKTPFTKENSTFIFKIAILMCALKFINLCLSTANLSPFSFNSFSIIEILIVFVIYIIFSYGVKLQSKTDDKLYE